MARLFWSRLKELYALHPSQTQGRLEMGGLSNGEFANDWAPQVLERKFRQLTL